MTQCSSAPGKAEEHVHSVEENVRRAVRKLLLIRTIVNADFDDVQIGLDELVREIDEAASEALESILPLYALSGTVPDNAKTHSIVI